MLPFLPSPVRVGFLWGFVVCDPSREAAVRFFAAEAVLAVQSVHDLGYIHRSVLALGVAKPGCSHHEPPPPSVPVFGLGCVPALPWPAT